MAKIISFTITLCIIGSINWGLTKVSNLSFIDSSFFVGLFSTAIIYFFSSSGGITSKNLDRQIQGQTGIKVNTSEHIFNPSYVFYASIVYLISAIIATLIFYFESFL